VSRQLVLSLHPPRCVVGSPDERLRGGDDRTDSRMGRRARADRDGAGVRFACVAHAREGRRGALRLGPARIRGCRPHARPRPGTLRAALAQRTARGRVLLRGAPTGRRTGGLPSRPPGQCSPSSVRLAEPAPTMFGLRTATALPSCEDAQQRRRSVTLAALSWHFIEAPSLARKPRRASARTAPAPCSTGPAWSVTSTGGP